MEDKILWKSQRKMIGRNFILAMIYFPLGFVLIWTAWFFAVPKSLWWIIAALPLTWAVMNDLKIFLNFKTMFLDIRGLTLNTNFNGKKFILMELFCWLSQNLGLVLLIFKNR